MPCVKNKKDGRVVMVGDSFRFEEHEDWELHEPKPAKKEKAAKKTKG
jgi:hypothetical protein